MSSWQLLSVITHNATRSLNFSIMFKSFLWSVELIGFSLLFFFSSVPNRMPQEMWSQGKSPKQFAHIKKQNKKEGNVMFADIWMLYLVIPSCIKWILLSTWRNMRRAECSLFIWSHLLFKMCICAHIHADVEIGGVWGEFMFCRRILRMSKQVLFVPESVYVGWALASWRSSPCSKNKRPLGGAGARLIMLCESKEQENGRENKEKLEFLLDN